MPEDGVDLQPQSKMINQQEILRLASMFVDAGVDKIRLTGGEVCVVHEPTEPGVNHTSASDAREFRADPSEFSFKLPVGLSVQDAAWEVK